MMELWVYLFSVLIAHGWRVREVSLLPGPADADRPLQIVIEAENDSSEA